MKPLRLAAIVGLSALSLCLASCVLSENPLSDSDKAEVDEDLIGLWAKETDGETDVLAIGRAGGVDGMPKGVMSNAEVRIDKDGRLSSTEATPAFFVSVIGKEKFMNFFNDADAVTPVTKDGKTSKGWNAAGIKQYTLAKYEVAKDKLTIWFGNQDPEGLVALIEAGKLAGEVKRDGGKLASVKLTGSTADLDKFLRNGGSTDLFPDQDKNPNKYGPSQVVYRRLKAGK